jgi:hypothetical protein
VVVTVVVTVVVPQAVTREAREARAERVLAAHTDVPALPLPNRLAQCLRGGAR